MESTEPGADPADIRRDHEQLRLGPRLSAQVTSRTPFEMKLIGVLDRAGALRLHAAVLDLIAERHPPAPSSDVLVDISELVHVDIEGLRLLVELDSALDTHGWTVVLQHPTAETRHLLARAGLSRALPVRQP